MHTEPSWARGALLSCLIAIAGAIGLSAALARADQEPRINAKVGKASWYGHEFGNRRTANGDRFDPKDLTGAHRTLPLGSRVRVTNLRNGRSVLLTITDRGPFRRLREIDVSLGAARLLGMVQSGIERVLIEPLS